MLLLGSRYRKDDVADRTCSEEDGTLLVPWLRPTFRGTLCGISRPNEFVRSIVMRLLEKLETYRMTVEASESLQRKVKAVVTGEHRAGSTDEDEIDKVDPLESFIKCVLDTRPAYQTRNSCWRSHYRD